MKITNEALHDLRVNRIVLIDPVDEDQPPVVTSTPAINFVEGIAGQYSLSQHVLDQGITPLVYSVSPGLQNGVTLDTSTGVLSYDGVGAATVFSQTFTVSNNAGQDTSPQFNINIQSIQLTGLSDPSLSTNPGGVADFAPTLPFIDIFKFSRPWNSPGFGDWDALNSAGHLDADGWMDTIPVSSGYVEAIWDWSSFSSTPHDGQQAVVSWSGTGTVGLIGFTELSRTSNSITVQFPASPGIIGITITATDPAPGNVRNITVIPTRWQSLYDNGARLNPDNVNLLKDMRLLRFMDWMQTNLSEVVNFSDYTTTDAVTYANLGNEQTAIANRVPLEHIADMCNRTQADCWVCFPHQATDACIQSIAEYFRDNLDTNLVCHFEVSNEVWNFTFNHWQYFSAQADAAWGTGQNNYNAALAYHGKRTYEASVIVDSVYAGQLGRRKNVMGCTNDDVTFPNEQNLIAPEWLANDPGNYVRPSTAVQAMAIAPYYGTAISSTPSLLAELATQYGAGTHLEWLYDYMTDPVNDSSVPGSIRNMELQKTLADQEGIELIMYEGMRHYLHAGLSSGDTLTAMLEFADSEHDANLVTQMWEAWERLGDGPLQVFSDIYTGGTFGVWGMFQFYGDNSPYAQALATLNALTPNWWGGTGDYRGPVSAGSVNYYPTPAAGRPGSVRDLKYHVWGHSIFTYTGGDTAVPTTYTRGGEWLGLLAAHVGLESVGSFTFGQYAQHNANDFSGNGSNVVISGTYDTGNTTPWSGDYDGQDYSHHFSMPSNFASDVGFPPFAGNDRTEFVSGFTTLDANIDAQYPNAQHILYCHQPDGGFYGITDAPSTSRALWTTYNNGTMGGWLDFHIEVQNELLASGYKLRMIPVGPVISWLVENGSYFSTLAFSDMHGDSAPHGTENFYFLSALVVFRALYGARPDLTGFSFPGAATQMVSQVTNNLAAIDADIQARLLFHDQNGVRVFD